MDISEIKNKYKEILKNNSYNNFENRVISAGFEVFSQKFESMEYASIKPNSNIVTFAFSLIPPNKPSNAEYEVLHNASVELAQKINNEFDLTVENCTVMIGVDDVIYNINISF